MTEKAYFSWSSGKDSALALYTAMISGEYDVMALFSVVKAVDKRLAMHEVGEGLLRRQAAALGLPFRPFYIDTTWTDEEYEANMAIEANSFKAQGIGTALFGDLYLDGLRRVREAKCRVNGIKAVFPLWGVSTDKVMSDFITLGFKAVVTCVDSSVLDESFVGRVIDWDFIADYPAGADICGENGEYHSFVFDGPVFKCPVAFSTNGTYIREYVNDGGSSISRYCYLNLE